MFCGSCGKENDHSHKFCRFCGSKMDGGSKKSRAFNKKYLVIAIPVILIIGVVLSWPFIHKELLIKQTIAKAEALESKGLYQDALAALTDVSIKTALASSSDEINSLTLRESQFASWNSLYAQASTSIDQGNYSHALDLLQQIDPSYPKYTSVKDLIIDTQKHIQNDLNAKVKAAEQKAAAQKAAAEEAQNAAQEAAAEATQATARTSMTAFFNQLQNIHNNFNNNCMGALLKAIQANNAGQSYSVYLGAAASACNSAQSDAKNLNDSYNNMPSSYVSAAKAMEWDAYYTSQSITAYVGEDYASAKYYIQQATPYDDEVTSFLSE